MRKIDLSSWPRRRHFDLFRSFDYPHFALTANVDITAFHAALKQQGLPFHTALVHLLASAANALPEFRQRIRGRAPDLEVVEHEVVHPSFTVPSEGELFSFCTVPYHPDLPTFAARAEERIRLARQRAVLEDEPGQDDLLYMTSLPWVSFTSLMHPIRLNPADSVPRIAWGKYFAEGERLVLPLSLQAHHGLMDGLHAGRFYQLVQERLGSGPLQA